jgi:hypothetical protein
MPLLSDKPRRLGMTNPFPSSLFTPLHICSGQLAVASAHIADLIADVLPVACMKAANGCEGKARFGTTMMKKISSRNVHFSLMPLHGCWHSRLS